MDCGLILGVSFVIGLVAAVGIWYAIAVGQMNSHNKKIDEYVNSINPNHNKPELNQELMSQMKPSDEVKSYIEYKFINPNSGRGGIGYVAVTEERLIFKAVSSGDYAGSMGALSGTAAQRANAFDLFAGMKEETCNVPIARVSSMSVSTQVFDYWGITLKPSGRTAEAFTLNINAEGLQYKLFLAKNKQVAEEFTRTFNSMSREKD